MCYTTYLLGRYVIRPCTKVHASIGVYARQDEENSWDEKIDEKRVELEINFEGKVQMKDILGTILLVKLRAKSCCL